MEDAQKKKKAKNKKEKEAHAAALAAAQEEAQAPPFGRCCHLSKRYRVNADEALLDRPKACLF